MRQQECMEMLGSIVPREGSNRAKARPRLDFLPRSR
jgi:hypothetical protein